MAVPPLLEYPSFPQVVEARAQQPVAGNRLLLIQDDRRWTFRQFRDECVRTAHFLLGRLGPIGPQRPPHVGILLENHLELLSLFGGCGFGGLTLFGIGTGLRGEVLAGVIDQSRVGVLIVDEKLYPEVERVAGALRHLGPENILVLPTQGGHIPADINMCERMREEVASEGTTLDAPDVAVTPQTPLMVIYTSGTTGLPKGVINNHHKLLTSGAGIAFILKLTDEDVGYSSMPLFHSNGMCIGFLPYLMARATIGLRERFTASGFLRDIKSYGATVWNYVGEPVHYVLNAIESEYGHDSEKIAAEVTNHPANRLRCAIGNGASPRDIDRFTEYLGVDHVFEFYGSSESAITVIRGKCTPRGSVGRLEEAEIKILDESGHECPPARLDERGRILNYAECVGEICRVSKSPGFFQGYYDNEEATRAKYCDGIYHSGDLGHVLVRDGQRYLFFDGRTEDWIRKDGENFSARQVGRVLSEHPDVQLVACYGVPGAVSDELVMAAVLLRPGASFDPQQFFDWCQDQVRYGSMDAKWIPDFVRVVREFEYTETQKALVRNLRRLHFDLNRLPPSELPIFFRQRGDTTFREFTAAEYAHLREEFSSNERLDLLDR